MRNARPNRRIGLLGIDQLEPRQLLSTASMALQVRALEHHHYRMPMHHAAVVWRAHPEHRGGAGVSAVGLVVNDSPANFQIIGQVNASFNSDAAITHNDVWAVGNSVVNGVTQPLAAHFDGASFGVVLTPTLSQGGNFYSVAAAAGNDVWAVGYQNVGSSINTLIEHWDGTSWSIVSSPKLPNGAYLQAITAISSADVWAAGDINVSKEGILMEHWDGTSWSVVQNPAFAGVGPIYGISASGSGNVWAVGGTTSLHFDGTNWNKVAASPKINTGSVTVLSSTDVWAAGIGSLTRNGFPRGLIEHWDGTSWSIVSTPWPNTRVSGGLGSIAGVSSSDIWATGSDAGPLIENWNGTSWSDVAFPTKNGIGPAAVLSDGTVFVATTQGFLLEN
jgi:hypothetical protein